MKLLTIILLILVNYYTYAQELVSNISETGLEKIKTFEAYAPKPYYDHKAYSIGYGTQRLCNGKKVTPRTKPMTEQEATKHLQCVIDTKNDLLIAYYIDNKIEISQSMHDSLLSFTYNLGSYLALKSSVFKHLHNKNCIAAKKSMLSYVKASGITLKGLVLRRTQEANDLLEGCQKINESLGFEYYKVSESKKKSKKIKAKKVISEE
jgi:GH24 family phage-related lysozyme (muramidase)